MDDVLRSAGRRGLAALLLWAWLGTLVHGDDTLKTRFRADEPIETLTVKIDSAAGGEDLAEPLALDLGLGFPFWLHPLGRQAGEAPPFGAVPQETTAGTTLPAGQSASFTFRASGEPGQDALLSTPQLLLGARVSDIARVGFASPATGDWALVGYEIQINGKPFVSRANLRGTARAARQAAAEKCSRIESQLRQLLWLGQLKASGAEPPSADPAAIGQFVQFALAAGGPSEEAAEDRLLDLLGSEAAPLVAERNRLRSLLAGKYPWLEDQGFQSPWRGGAEGQPSAIRSAKVILETYPHAGADTENYVYLQTGGHKYPLASPRDRAFARGGAREFDLDLLAGPLGAADVRGWALGMLAGPMPSGKAPDRWHPRRFLVEIDGRTVYDSDENALDRRSLEAIRLVPPAYLDEEGQSVVHATNVRETTLWQAGMGAGLDPSRGEPLPLPDPADPTYPLPESDLSPALTPSEEPAEEPADSGTFPGEGDLAGEATGGGVSPSGAFPSGSSGAEPADELGQPGQPGQPNPAENPWLPPSVNPPPAGDPLQVEDVKLAAGWKQSDSFTIRWKVSGDESQIDHYDVSLRVVRPETPQVYFEEVIHAAVPKTQREYTGTLDATVVVDEPYYFLAPMVVAVPTDPAQKTPSHQRIGAARAIFPANTDVALQPSLDAQFQYTRPPSLLLGSGGVAFGGEPSGTGRAVWPLGQLDSQNAIAFDASTPGLNVGVRPEPGDSIHVGCSVGNFTGRQRLIAHLGMLGAGAAKPMDVELVCRLTDATGAKVLHEYPPVSQKQIVAAGPMGRIEQIIDAADAGGSGPCRLAMSFRISGGDGDAIHPPALVGLRLVPEMSGKPVPLAGDTKTITADLELIVPSKPRPENLRNLHGITLVSKNVVIVKNLGPDEVNAAIMMDSQVATTWRMAPWGDRWAEIKDTKYYAPISQTTEKGKLWTLPVGQQREIDIGCPNHLLPPGQAAKFFGAQVKLVVPESVQGSTDVFHFVDPHPENNVYESEEAPPLVVGYEPLLWEVAFFEDAEFQKPLAYWEAPPSLRQRLIPSVSPDIRGKIRAYWTGRKVVAWGFPQPEFESDCIPWRTAGGQKAALGEWSGRIASVILVGDRDIDLDPKSTRLFGGVVTFSGMTIVGGVPHYDWTWGKPDNPDWPYKLSKVFPGPERRDEKERKYASLGKVSGNVDLFAKFLGIASDPDARYNAGYVVQARVFEKPGCQGQSQELGYEFNPWSPAQNAGYWSANARSLEILVDP